MMEREIEITDAAVVRKLRFFVGEEGITELLGAMGTGKSTALRRCGASSNIPTAPLPARPRASAW
jgi:ABC-type cobalamin/Fe3+-siderophores transport system ATPase subunit